MSNLIEDMFLENFNAQEYIRMNNIPIADFLKPVLLAEEKLRQTLEADSVELLDKYVEIWNSYNEEATLDSFVAGFRLGAKLIMDIYAVYDENVPSLI